MLKAIRMSVMCFIGLSGACGAAPLDAGVSWLGATTTIDKANEATLPAALARANENGGTVVLGSGLRQGRLPVTPTSKTRTVDLRYPGGINLVRGNHPRLEGIWPQYTELGTGLGRNLVISDVLPFAAQVENWKGEPMRPNAENRNRAQDSHEYSNSHNHYQNLLSEVWSFSPTVNAVSLWGDSGAFYPGAKSWGGFLSARSWPVHWKEYVPPGTPTFKDEDFDAQLVGLEVDVLNGGLPDGVVSKSIGMPLSKTGIQIVGFGNRNSAAIELRSEDSDDLKKQPDDRRGTWRYGIIAYNSLDSGSTLIYSATPKGRVGLDLSRTDYSEGALRLRSEGRNTGIVLNDAHGGEIFATDGRLNIRFGDQGFDLINPGGRSVLSVGRWGLLTWNGLNLAFIGLLFLATNVWLLLTVVRQRRALAGLSARLDRMLPPGEQASVA